jgi:membrane protease YdiL (CAAX protease family)
MGKGTSYIEIIMAIFTLIILVIPPWVVFRRYIRDKFKRVFLIIFFLIYIGVTILTIRSAQNFIPFVLVVLILIFNRKYRYDEEDAYYFRPLQKNKIEVFLYAIIFSFLIRLVNMVVVLFMQQIFHVETKPQDVIEMFMKSSWMNIIVLVLMTVVFAPVLEEFIFRHFIYRGFTKKVGKVWAAIFSSILFSFLHYNLAASISIFAVGIYNCYLYDKYGYRAAVLNHLVFNFSSTIFIILIKAANLKVA